MNLIDTHCHLNSFANTINDILSRAKEALVESMIACGTEPMDWNLHYNLANLHSHIHYAVGIHPTNINGNWENDLSLLDSFFQKNLTPIAIGEIGLDYHFLEKNISETIALQKEIFRQQLFIARQKNCPIIIHSRDAFEDCKQIIDQSGCDWNKIVVHCFSENENAMHELNDRGGRASFTGIVTYKNAENVRQSLRVQGVERLMLETDCPYLAPVPFRSKKNEPAFLRETAHYVANLLGIEESELCNFTTRNAKQFFCIS